VSANLRGSRFGFWFLFFLQIVTDDLDLGRAIRIYRQCGHASDPSIECARSQPCGHYRGDESDSELGAGLLESAYQACLHHELHQTDIQAACQVGLPVVYRGVKLEIGYRIDLLVEDLVIVEIKSVDATFPVHQAQIISYLKVSGRSLGLLINFNVVHLRDGIRRFVSGTEWKENQTFNH
jgi:GxxExxY protein